MYTELLDAKLEEGYSDRAVAGRRQLLDEVPRIWRPVLDPCCFPAQPSINSLHPCSQVLDGAVTSLSCCASHRQARAVLMSSRPGQPLYGSGAAPKALTVSWDALPGALCLLREVCLHLGIGCVLHEAAAAAAVTWHLDRLSGAG